MNITMLGTGHALVTKYYNTCFVISDEDRHFLVDGGGGNQILRNLQETGIDWHNIHDVFVTHQHVDHFMGIIWMVRVFCDAMNYDRFDGDVNIYSSAEVIGKIREISKMLLRWQETRFLDDRVHLIAVADGETREVLGRKTTFFDIGSTSVCQFGFTMEMTPSEGAVPSMDGGGAVYETPAAGDGRITCLGDEPCHETSEKYVQGSEWLLHEAFCLYEERDIYHPYEIAHSTVKDACELAERLGVQNLLLYHTEDGHYEDRAERYLAEGRPYFSGRLVVPEDLERVELN